MKRIIIAVAVALLATAAPTQAHRRHADTNPIAVAQARAVAYWGASPCAGRVTVAVSAVAPAEQGGVTGHDCTVTLADQSWASWFGIEQTFPEFCSLMAYGYGELLGRAQGNVTVTPECARHAAFWWRNHRYFTWRYDGASYFSATYYPTDLKGV